MTVRWTFEDTVTHQVVELPVNPREMDSPLATRNVKYGFSARGVLSAIDTGADRPVSWSFSGVILTKSHYDLLLAWAKRSTVLHVTDHLLRTYEVLIQQYSPIERAPSPTRPWRADYTMTCLLLKEVL